MCYSTFSWFHNGFTKATKVAFMGAQRVLINCHYGQFQLKVHYPIVGGRCQTEAL